VFTEIGFLADPDARILNPNTEGGVAVSVQKEVVKRKDGTKRTSWRVRWKDENDRWRNQSFERKRDADDFDADLRRRKRRGTLAELDAGTETLDSYVVETWIPIHGHLLEAKTRKTYTSLYDFHISPYLGSTPLRALTVELIGRWQADRRASGAGKVSIRQAKGLLGNILQRAHEGGRITSNPVRLVPRPRDPGPPEVRPFPPSEVEAIRAHLEPRDAMFVSLMAYAGLRPGEALALRWSQVFEQTLRITRAASMGVEKGTKTRQNRTVRLLQPLALDLAEWRLRCGRPQASALVIPDRTGKIWTESAYKSWSRRTFGDALSAGLGGTVDDPTSQQCATCGALPGNPCRTPKRKLKADPHVARTRMKVEGRPYHLRHSFASLLILQGESIIYVARQLGHDAQLTLSTYGHVFDEFQDRPRLDAETAIREAREARSRRLTESADRAAG
jgi:integrase